MINPINHGNTAESIAKYKVEPYVIAADVYAVSTHMGRGGWTWYTGSAGWMYQLITESLMGLRRKGNTLRFDPCIPEEWPSATIHYRYEDTVYHITFVHNRNNEEEIKIILNGAEQSNSVIYLVNDQAEHKVSVQLPFKKTEESGLVLVPQLKKK